MNTWTSWLTATIPLFIFELLLEYIFIYYFPNVFALCVPLKCLWLYRQPRNIGNPTSGFVAWVGFFIWLVGVFLIEKHNLVFVLAVLCYHIWNQITCYDGLLLCSIGPIQFVMHNRQCKRTKIKNRNRNSRLFVVTVFVQIFRKCCP